MVLTNAMSVDVEDYFQVSAFNPHIDRADWDGITSRVERNIESILALFSEHQIHATFFTLGWIAERHPDMLRRIADAGHEIASHGYEHLRVTTQTREQFRQDITRTRKILEDVSGKTVKGFRAASFSINSSNLWALDELAEAGYQYSSSIYPVSHDHYGMPDAPRFPFHPEGSALLEIPISTVEIMNKRYPCGGGGFFRLLPYKLSRLAIRHVNQKDKAPALFYFHPWEIDPEQPRQRGLPLKTRFRHYVNLSRMEGKIARLLNDFQWGRMDRVFLDTGNRGSVLAL